MKSFFRVMVTMLALLGCIGVASASQKDEAKGLVKKAVALIKEKGNEKAFAEINNPAGKFVKGELYVFVFDAKGIVLAHGATQKLVGKNMHDLKDSDGRFFVQDILKAGKPGGGWTEYNWSNPATKKIAAKTTYVEPAGDSIVGCGFYK